MNIVKTGFLIVVFIFTFNTTSQSQELDLGEGYICNSRDLYKENKIISLRRASKQIQSKIKKLPKKAIIKKGSLKLTKNNLRDCKKGKFAVQGELSPQPTAGFDPTAEPQTTVTIPTAPVHTAVATYTATATATSTPRVIDVPCVTGEVSLTGNLDALADKITSIPHVSLAGTHSPNVTFSELNQVAQYAISIEIFDYLGAAHQLQVYFFHVDTNQYLSRVYASSEDVDVIYPLEVGYARMLSILGGYEAHGTVVLNFNGDGTLSQTSIKTLELFVPWNNGSNLQLIRIDLGGFFQYATSFMLINNDSSCQ